MRPIIVFLLVFAVSACATVDRMIAPVVPQAAEVAPTERVFFGTTRAPNPDGALGFGRTSDLRLGVTEISVPPNRMPGQVSNGGATPDPLVDFVIAEEVGFPSTTAFQRALRANPGRRILPEREVTVFVHGFNNSFSDSLFRAAQIQYDLEVPGAMIVYSWPSRGHALGYEYDRDSVQFARDGLEELLRNVHSSRSGQIVLVAHSMGAELAMETLRQIEKQEPGWTGRNLSGVMLISPDIDIDVFRSQMSQIRNVPDPFVIFASRRDRALRLSAGLTGLPSRLGNLTDVALVADLPVAVVDVTAFSEGPGLNHFVPASSPALIAMFQRSENLDREFLRGQSGTPAPFLGAERVIVQNATEIVLRPFAR
ncbi:alpha/beta fold hydrolase [Aestuariivita sp.]|uniref:alpha/beta hydrolase n=1 Tax=Aestuariivita sp. TaxID=1872407 RepID=UPI0021701752|nr:alpha/beta fold hydrolase [Aestuariivita sp.]MCE8005527.1 alpha/beta fold hydrolase [Aestuariivita sp.]